MGPNSKRAQSAAASASKFTPSRARFSKPPPKKNAGGKGGRGGKGGGRASTTTAATANVVQRIAGRQQHKETRRRDDSSAKFDHKEALDELTLSAATMAQITQLLTDLNVVQHPAAGPPRHDNPDAADVVVVDDPASDATRTTTSTTPLVVEDQPQTPVDWTRDPIFLHLTQQLSFAPADAARAAQQPSSSTLADTPAARQTQNLMVAMDWLCLHLSEQALEQGFRRRPQRPPPPKQRPFSQKPPLLPAAPPADWQNLAWREERAARYLRFGFFLREIMAAQKDDVEETEEAAPLRPVDNSPLLRKLLGRLERTVLGGAAPAVQAQPADQEEDDETWADREEEREALASIYDDRFADIVNDCDGMDRYKIKLAAATNLPTDGSSKSVLHVFLRRGYPTRQAPLLLCYNATLPAALLRHVNVRLMEFVQERVGRPVIFDAVTMLSAELPAMQEYFILQQQRDNKSDEMKLPLQVNHGEKLQERVHTVDTGIHRDPVQPARTASPRAAGPPTDAQPHFTDKLRTMQGTANSTTKSSGAYVLSAPKKRDQDSAAEQESLPCPVVVPVGELAVAMEEVVEVQKNQPWLVSSEARVPGAASQPEELNQAQLDRQRHISKQLRSELEQRWGSALEGANLSAPPARPFQKMLAQRERLPAYAMKDHIIATIANNQITVIAGDTGCGKTTQVPALVLDDLIAHYRGADANIIITQPRRISAIGVAERIASERCERVGDSCGYSIKLERKVSKKTRLLLCTTGIILRRLQCDPDLASVSHVFVDEVHERDLNTDFLLIILKDLLARRKSLKLVLMSATLNADAFSDFFAGCSIVNIPGRAHPVQEFRLEDVLQLTGYEVREGSDYAMKARGPPTNRLSKAELRKLYPTKYDSKVIQSLSVVDESVVNYELLAQLLEQITKTSDEGAILVFMPGMMEITKATEEIKRKAFLNDPSVALVLPLHSSLSTAEQKAVFDVPPRGVRKIIVATNIAETSITIEDVVYVVDAGRVKENRRDEVKETPALIECWVSRASAKQRRGRAGRVRPGIAYHMYSSHTHDSELQDYQLPEMLRVGLEDLALQILILDLGEPSDFLGRAMNPPTGLAMRNSLKLLEELGAVECQWESSAPSSKKDDTAKNCSSLSVSTELTALGFHLATLPVDPRVGKMIIYGALFGCVEPALTIAASMSSRSPFVSPFENRDAANEARQQFATEGSDHLTVLTAFNEWKNIRLNEGDRAARDFLRDSFLSRMTLFQMDESRKQYAKLLVDIGFLPRGFRLTGKEHGANSNAKNLGLVKAVLAAGLYPNIIVAPQAIVNGTSKQAANGIAFKSRNKGDVHLHPCTIMFTAKRLDSRYCCFHEIVKTTKMYIRDCTTVSPFALVLFGGALRVYPDQGVASVDNWLKFRIGPKPATLVKFLRSQMENMLLQKIIDPQDTAADHPEGKALIESVSTLLRIEGQTSAPSFQRTVKPEATRPRQEVGQEHSREENGGGRQQNGRGRGRGRGSRGGGRSQGGQGRGGGRKGRG